jgi:hypothetical protein
MSLIISEGFIVIGKLFKDESSVVICPRLEKDVNTCVHFQVVNRDSRGGLLAR